MFIKSEDIPYLKQFPNDGRIRPLISYFDGKEWHTYFPQEGKILDFKPVEYVSGIYLAKNPAKETDFEIPLLTFLFQRIPTKETFDGFDLLYADLENSLAVLHKQFILFRHFRDHDDVCHGRVISTELEYALFNHRSAYDLLNRFVIGFLERHGFKKNEMPDSFARVAEKSEHIRIKFGMSTPLAKFYTAKKDRFMLFRSVRDAIGHHGHSIDLIFKMPHGFGISGGSLVGKRLKEKALWDSMKPIPNDIGSSFALFAYLADDLVSGLADFTEAFVSSFKALPPETAPGYRIYARSPLADHRNLLADYLANPWRM